MLADADTPSLGLPGSGSPMTSQEYVWAGQAGIEGGVFPGNALGLYLPPLLLEVVALDAPTVVEPNVVTPTGAVIPSSVIEEPEPVVAPAWYAQVGAYLVRLYEKLKVFINAWV